jgi:hypothetical protein
MIQSSFLSLELMLIVARVDNITLEDTTSMQARIATQKRQRGALWRYGTSDGCAKNRFLVGSICA